MSSVAYLSINNEHDSIALFEEHKKAAVDYLMSKGVAVINADFSEDDFKISELKDEGYVNIPLTKFLKKLDLLCRADTFIIEGSLGSSQEAILLYQLINYSNVANVQYLQEDEEYVNYLADKLYPEEENPVVENVEETPMMTVSLQENPPSEEE